MRILTVMIHVWLVVDLERPEDDDIFKPKDDGKNKNKNVDEQPAEEVNSDLDEWVIRPW